MNRRTLAAAQLRAKALRSYNPAFAA
uniref:Uncharacterized protein n=1 Tax=Anguilla anguilla TaxID=7936 RepID=A0A0E9XMX9_ANGAN